MLELSRWPKTVSPMCSMASLLAAGEGLAENACHVIIHNLDPSFWSE